MIVRTDEGRARTVRTPEERKRAILRRMSALPPDERRLLKAMLYEEQRGESLIANECYAKRYKAVPVDMATFIDDPYYLGDSCQTLYPVLRRKLIEIFEPGSHYREVILGGGTGVGKTTCLSIIMCRLLYEISCLVNPQASYGLSPGSELSIALVSKNLIVCRQVLKSAIDNKMELSPYFQEHFKPEMRTEATLFPSNVQIIVSSYVAERTIGSNCFAASLDETDFVRSKKQQIRTTDGQQKSLAHFDLAEKAYRSLERRIKSRFIQASGDLPGMIVMVSSANTVGGFIERRMASAYSDPSVYAMELCTWEIKPPGSFSGKRFKVLCGGSSLRSRILGEGEDIDVATLPDEARVIAVPEEYRVDFESNLEDSIREIAGVPTTAISAFIQRTEMIKACVDPKRTHPADKQSWQFGDPLAIYWHQLAKMTPRRLPGGYEEEAWTPLRNPKALRYCHIDTSLSGDATGICLAHVERYVDVVRRTPAGEHYTDKAPYFVIDFLLQVRPPHGEQIQLADIRALIYDFMAHGFSLIGFSCDLFQSADMLQAMKRRGVAAEILSVDTSMAPYEALRSALYEKRIELYDHAVLMTELRALEHDRLRGKVDHPVAGGKDCVSGETKISLLDGREVPIEDLVGDEFWVYACTPEGMVVPARAHNVHPVGMRDLIRVWLDNGEFVDCTPDHEIMMRDGSFREARLLIPGDSLMPLYRDVSVKDPRHGLDGYERILDNKTGKRVFTHQMVARSALGFEYAGSVNQRRVIHHADFNKRNNTPENLVPLEWNEHLELHREVSSENMKRMWEDEEYRAAAKVRSGITGKLTGPRNITRYNRSAARIEKLHAMGTFSANGRSVMEKLWKDPLYRRRHSERMSGSNNPHSRKDVTLQRILEEASKVTSHKDLLVVLGCTQKVVMRVLRENGTSYREIADMFGHDRNAGKGAYVRRVDVTMERILAVARTVKTVRDLCEILKCTPKVYHRVLAENGFTPSDFCLLHFGRKPRNHRVVRVEPIEDAQVFDMTVDVHHNFAISSGIFIHNCADAMAGAIAGLLKKAARAPLGVLKPEEGRGDVDDMSWVTGAPAPEKDIEVPLMPFLFG